MRQITLDGLQRNPADSWNHNAFLQLHDLTQQAMTISKTSVWADSENPSQDFVPADPTQEYIPPRPPRTNRGEFQLGSGRMRKPVATQDTGGPSSTPHVSPYRPASPHHHPSPPFEQMHFDSDFINLDPNGEGSSQCPRQGPSDGTMPFTQIALGKGQRNIKKKKKCCMTDSREKKRKM
ncbi:OLC1v1012672C1 [Oldenlandia corymbosa var. corymbosa]|uniref:OLC1v1012672C1 n=1 Tax=Oldenlandia corymbosa var. corymbosa TaxID=529605 RepID=A0AAV1DYY1_OLDCO|nr:OLC1v1012672C1 [Oldenlandia corymbosa var. corymbosa]